eukprot:g5287.t1
MKQPARILRHFLPILAFAFLAIADVAAGAAPSSLSAIRIETGREKNGTFPLRGRDSGQQLVVIGVGAGDSARDVTREVRYAVAPEGIVTVDATGWVAAVREGTATISVKHADGQTAAIRVVVTDIDRDVPINFANEVVPIFTKYGCNSGGCHGKSGGQNGFSLSLLGFEAREDFEYLTREARGRRLFPTAPESSLLLAKASGDLPHGGGARIKRGTPAYNILRRWIAQGMPFGQPGDPKLECIEVFPKQNLLSRRSTQQLIVVARYDDGTTRDVTRMTQFESNQKEIAEVGETGLVTAADKPGVAAVMTRFQIHVDVNRSTVPLGETIGKLPAVANFIDRYVQSQWKNLGLPPSAVCDDSTFIRRVTIDIAGRLPTLEETKTFLADRSKNKRAQLIDRLLDSGAYADYFAAKWSAILRNKRTSLNADSKATFAFHKWIRESLAANKPYDKFVREILTAKGEEIKNPPVRWYNEVKDVASQVEDSSQLFLGTRIQCARCHHHPFEKWSQQDYYQLAAFFSKVDYKKPPKPKRRKGKKNRKKKTPPPPLHLILKDKMPPVKNPKTGETVQPAGLGGEAFDVSASVDPRTQLADWMTAKSNPFFARTLVNRYWKHFFGRGIVDPEDDMRVTNPASNPELLAALEARFKESDYDLKDLVRTICNSTTYQLSAISNRHNKDDRQSFSRFVPRRLNAEVLLDGIDFVTATPTRFKGVAGGTRAVQLPDNAFDSYFLKVFGRPDSSSACECERSTSTSLAQLLHLLNSREILSKTAGKRVSELARDKRPHAERIEELYLLAYSRKPSTEEIAVYESYIRKKGDRGVKTAYEDIVWTIINSEESYSSHLGLRRGLTAFQSPMRSRVAICARDEEELRAAEQDLADRGATVFAARCDVANRDQVEEFAATAAECLGPIDVLVNNAGIIQIGPLDAMSLEDFEQTIDVMYWGVLHPTLAVLPHMRKRGRGRIVNIASIGGLVSLPHLTPYGCAKSAAIALSEGLHAELAGTGIHVTTVVPGIMRIGSHLNACFAGQAEKEYRWFSLGASLPLMSVSGERAARIIVSATKRRKAFQFIGLPAAVLARLHGLFPGTTARVLRLTNRWLLPDGAGSETSTQLRGKDARDKLDSRIVTVKALRWYGKQDVRVETVPDPAIVNARDAIIKVTSTAICGSDLHLYVGRIPTMQEGDILGHEFMGEVVDVGSNVQNLQVGDRVVVPFTIACGNCFFCRRSLWSLCDNSNPNAGMSEKLYGYSPSGLFGYSHMMGGYAGGQAEYVRVPFADVGPFKISSDLPDEKVLFLSDIFPTGYMAAENADIEAGDTVAVWGCGPVGQFAIWSAWKFGADRVIAIDREPERLRLARNWGKAETLNFEETDIFESLKEMTGGRGPDACIDAVGSEAHGTTIDAWYDVIKNKLLLETDRAHVLRQAIHCCRKGGRVSIPGVYGGLIDKPFMSRTPEEQLVSFLSDMYSVELQALAQLETGPDMVGDPALAAAFSEHHVETERQAEKVRGRLEAHGGSPSHIKDAVMKLGGKGFLLFARVLPETPGRLVVHSYSYEAMEWAGYEMLRRFAESVGDDETVRIAKSIAAEERAMMERLASGFDLAEETSHADTPPGKLNQHILKHLAEVHAFESQAAQLLKRSEKIIQEAALEKLYSGLLEETHRHAQLVEQHLESRTSSVSKLKDAALAVGGFNWSLFFQAQSDTAAKLAAFVYAVLHLEIGGYELLKRTARRAGDSATEELCADLSEAKFAMADRLAKNFDAAADASLAALKA